jgi:hypothetical protein
MNTGMVFKNIEYMNGGVLKFIVSQLLWHGASVFPVSSEGPPQLIASYDSQGNA